jgi:hypothetical protein
MTDRATHRRAIDGVRAILAETGIPEAEQQQLAENVVAAVEQAQRPEPAVMPYTALRHQSLLAIDAAFVYSAAEPLRCRIDGGVIGAQDGFARRAVLQMVDDPRHPVAWPRADGQPLTLTRAGSRLLAEWNSHNPRI